ncbi:MAG: phosphoglycerate mutase [Patescibacteria group bacterium]|nr:MAG: phosphoglycerate mutase [Patescibacteria group bacterium]
MKKYCTFYIVRHGVTEWNKLKKIQGQTDVPLTKEGEEQAKKAAIEYFNNIHFSSVFSSDLIRAKRTAEIIALEKGLAVSASKLLRERSFGSFEGKVEPDIEKEMRISIAELKALTDKEREKMNIETDKNLWLRFVNFIREVASVYLNKNVLIVTHGSLMSVVLQKLAYITKDQINRLHIGNLAYIILLSDGVEFEIRETFGIFLDN